MPRDGRWQRWMHPSWADGWVRVDSFAFHPKVRWPSRDLPQDVHLTLERNGPDPIPSHPHLPSSIEIIAPVTPTECATARLVENRQHRVPSIEGYLASVECLDDVSPITPDPLSDSIHHVLSRTREPRDAKKREMRTAGHTGNAGHAT